MAIPFSAAAAMEIGRAAAALREFLERHREVRVREAGALVTRLRAADSGFALQTEHGKLVFHFWSPDVNLVRHVVGYRERAGGFELQCRRLGKSQPQWTRLEGGEGACEAPAGREDFRAAIAQAALRSWPGWEIERTSGTRGAGQRLVLRRGRRRMACLAVSEREAGAGLESALAAGLVWAEQLRRRSGPAGLDALKLVLPAALHALVRRRQPGLRREPPIECLVFDRTAGELRPAELEDAGNLESRVPRAPELRPEWPAAARARLAQVRGMCPEAGLEAAGDGSWRIRLHGLTLAGPEGYGCGREQSPYAAEGDGLFERWLRQVNAQRHRDGHGAQPYYAAQPERWMEEQLRRDLGALDAACDPRWVYRQVPAVGGGQRDILDLLAVDREGRLLVVELKAGEDMGFPLQALDYWLRVRRHLEAGDFERMGYFPGVRLSRQPPRLLLLAPALRWHPHTPALLAWLAPELAVERLGCNEEWRRGLQIVARWPGG